MKQKNKEASNILAAVSNASDNEVAAAAATTSKQSKVSANSKAIKKQTAKKTNLTKEKVNVMLGDDDSLKENKNMKAKSSKQMSSNSSSDEFEDVDADEVKKKKSKQKPKSTAAAKKTPTPQKVKPENKLDSIEQILRMETQSKATRSNLNNETMEFNDDDSDFEEVEMNNGEEHLAEMLKRNASIEVNVQTKKTKKEVDLKAKMERMFKAAQKQLRITMIKTHIVCWLTHGLYLNSLVADKQLIALALSLESKFQVKKFQLVNFNKKTLCELLAKINKNVSCEIGADEDLFNKSTLITQETLCEAISQLKCKNFLLYHLIVLAILRNHGIKSRLCVCFDVIPLGEEKSPAAKTSTAKRPTTSRKNNKKILSTGNFYFY